MWSDPNLWNALSQNTHYYGNGNYKVSPNGYVYYPQNWKDYYDQFTYPTESNFGKRRESEFDELNYELRRKFDKLNDVLDIYQPEQKQDILKGLTPRDLIWHHVWVGSDEGLQSYLTELEKRSDKFIKKIINLIRAPLDIIFVFGEHAIIQEVKTLIENFHSISDKKYKDMLITIIYKKYLSILFSISHQLLDEQIERYDKRDLEQVIHHEHRKRQARNESSWVPRDGGPYNEW